MINERKRTLLTRLSRFGSGRERGGGGVVGSWWSGGGGAADRYSVKSGDKIGSEELDCVIDR